MHQSPDRDLNLSWLTRQLRNSDGVSGSVSECPRIEKRAIGAFSTV